MQSTRPLAWCSQIPTHGAHSSSDCRKWLSSYTLYNPTYHSNMPGFWLCLCRSKLCDSDENTRAALKRIYRGYIKQSLTYRSVLWWQMLQWMFINRNFQQQCCWKMLTDCSIKLDTWETQGISNEGCIYKNRLRTKATTLCQCQLGHWRTNQHQ
jgi:hypothetical protein